MFKIFSSKRFFFFYLLITFFLKSSCKNCLIEKTDENKIINPYKFSPSMSNYRYMSDLQRFWYSMLNRKALVFVQSKNCSILVGFKMNRFRSLSVETNDRYCQNWILNLLWDLTKDSFLWSGPRHAAPKPKEWYKAAEKCNGEIRGDFAVLFCCCGLVIYFISISSRLPRKQQTEVEKEWVNELRTIRLRIRETFRPQFLRRRDDLLLSFVDPFIFHVTPVNKVRSMLHDGKKQE